MKRLPGFGWLRGEASLFPVSAAAASFLLVSGWE